MTAIPKPVKKVKVKVYKLIKTRKPKRKKTERQKLVSDCLAIWSRAVKERDKTCRHCNGSTGLQSHHIRSVGHKSTMFLLSNGLTICNSLHCMQKFNPEYFQDKIIEIIGDEFYNELKVKSLMTVKRNIQDLKDMKSHLQSELTKMEDGINYNDLPF